MIPHHFLMGLFSMPMPAYIDPGVLSMALQAIFVFVFGAIATYIMAPWKWFSARFRGKKADPNTTSGAADQGPADASSKERQ